MCQAGKLFCSIANRNTISEVHNGVDEVATSDGGAVCKRAWSCKQASAPAGHLLVLETLINKIARSANTIGPLFCVLVVF